MEIPIFKKKKIFFLEIGIFFQKLEKRYLNSTVKGAKFGPLRTNKKYLFFVIYLKKQKNEKQTVRWRGLGPTCFQMFPSDIPSRERVSFNATFLYLIQTQPSVKQGELQLICFGNQS